MKLEITVLVAALLAGALFASVASAQTSSSSGNSIDKIIQRVQNQNVRNYSVRSEVNRSVNRGLSSGAPIRSSVFGNSFSRPTSKPFSYVSQRPTVSPYLNLLRSDVGDAAPNYYSLVRPQLQANRFAAGQSRRNQQVYRQLQSLQARAAYPASGSQRLVPTGHQTVFQNHLHYYPQRRR